MRTTSAICQTCCKLRILVTALTLSAVTLSLHAEPTPLVDISFDGLQSGQAPPLLRGSMPTNLPTDQLAFISFGSVVVTNDIPGMDNPVAQLKPAPTPLNNNFIYSQPDVYRAYNIPSTAKRFLFSMDVFLSNFQKAAGASRSVDDLGILFDQPTVQRIDFTTDGTTGRMSIGSGTPVYNGNFEFDRAHTLTTFVDVEHRIWSAWLDRLLLFTNTGFPGLGGDGHLRAIRINLADDATLPNVPLAYIDNLRLLEFNGTLIVLQLPEQIRGECGVRQTVSALVGHGNGRAMNLVWSVAGVPVATNVVPASTPLDLTQVDLNLDLPLGQTDIQLTATDADGATYSATSTITVVDTTPPTIANATAYPATLWPPNGQMVPVKIDALVQDDCSTSDWGVVRVYSNEPNLDNADIEITSDTEVKLRARRAGTLGDRIYTVELLAVDEAENISQLKTVQVVVPHDARNSNLGQP